MAEHHENLFVLTGIDGSGKSTLLESARRLRPAWAIGSLHPQDWLPHPALPHLDWAVERHPKTVLHQLEPTARATLLLDLLVSHWEYWVRPRLDAGETVLLDSFYYRFYAKEQVRGLVPKWFFDALDELPNAGTVIVADVAPARAAARLERFDVYEVERDTTHDDFVRFQTRVSDALLAACGRAGRVVTIDGRRPPDEVLHDVVAIVDEGAAAARVGFSSPVDRARVIADDVLRPTASKVDVDNRFPHEGLAALREAGLLGYFVPARCGGTGGDFATYARIARRVLGDGCLSVAMIWAMHAQQVATLADHGGPAHDEHLVRIARDGVLLASVISEHGKGGDVLRAEAPLVEEGDGLRLRREAPVVSYGEAAGYFLVTMRSAADRPTTDVALVLVERGDGVIEATGGWDAMGMRGTRSIPMRFDVTVGRDRLVGGAFRHTALATLVPAAHIGWTAAWLGAAEGAQRRLIDWLRQSQSKLLGSDRVRARLAEQRASLDLVAALLDQVVTRADRLRRTGASPEAYEDVGANLAVNNLKVTGAKLTFEVAHGLVELAGAAKGYLRDDLGLERLFRDLRSASLMFGNDRLLDVNGRLLLVEATPAASIWSAEAGW